MEVRAVLGVKGLVEGDIVISSNDYLGLEIRLLQPLYSFRKLSNGAIVSAWRE